MTRRSCLFWIGLNAGIVSMSSMSSAAGAEPGKPADVQTSDQAAAQQHFQQAKELYQAGSYKEAVAELEAARALDPKAKDLVFNLGIVHEKLQKFDEAIDDFRSYLDMDGISPGERQKAEMSIKRIEGAKREIIPGESAVPTDPTRIERLSKPAPPILPPLNGRIDAITVTAAAIGVVGLGAGTVFGIRAVSLRPTGFVTGRDGSYSDFQDRTDSAHVSALVADVGFGIGIVATAVAAYFFFGRSKSPLTTSASITPFVGGAAVLVGGRFQ